MERLKIYFIHSKKFDYENLIYKKVLESTICVTQNFILPYTKNNEEKYAKDLIESSDLIVVDLYNPSIGLTIELKWLQKMPNKKVLFLSQDNQIPVKYSKMIEKISTYDNNKTYINLIEDFINQELEERSKVHDNIYTLGEI